MDTPFDAYTGNLRRRELAPLTRVRYAQVLTAYRGWLKGQPPTKESALDFLAELRQKGYRTRSLLLYYHVIRSFQSCLGEEVTP